METQTHSSFISTFIDKKEAEEIAKAKKAKQIREYFNVDEDEDDRD
ncbi:MAG: hypothetical protein SNI70_06100 [Rikenellaceae bacterium]